MTTVARAGSWKASGVAPGDTGLHVGCVGCSRRQPDPEDFVDGVKDNAFILKAVTRKPQRAWLRTESEEKKKKLHCFH